MADELLTDLPGDLPTFLKRFGTHGAVQPKHLPAYLDEFVFRFNRRTARSIAHRFARVIQQAVLTHPRLTAPSSPDGLPEGYGELLCANTSRGACLPSATS